MKRGALIGVASTVVVIAIIGVFLLANLQALTGPTMEMTVLGGEIDLSGPYGFALEGQQITSPGPKLTLKVGEKVKITFKDIGQIKHTFRIVREAMEGAESLWGAQLGTANSPIDPGKIGTVEFKPQEAGEFFYVCVVPGHISVFGMKGLVIVEG